MDYPLIQIRALVSFVNLYLLEVCSLTCRFLNFNYRFLFLFDLTICETISSSSDFLFPKYRVYDYVRFRTVADQQSLRNCCLPIYSVVRIFIFIRMLGDRARTSSSLYVARRTSKSTSTLFISVAKSQDLRRLTQIGICRFAFLYDFIIQEVISRVSSSRFVEVQQMQTFGLLFDLIWSDSFSVWSIQELVDFCLIIRVSDCS